MSASRRLILFVLIVVLCGLLLAVFLVQPGATREVTFARDVAPIVHSKCATCHHPGESAPFSLLSYDDVRHRAGQIVEVTQSRFMPPWLPTVGHGEFVDARRLSDSELGILKRWFEAGSPRGEESKEPAAPDFAGGWRAGTPDLILESPVYNLTEKGGDVFRNFVVPVSLPEPRWIESIELRAENPRVAHHARLGVDSSKESVRRDAEDPEPGYAGMAWGQDPEGQLVIWAPGMSVPAATPGVAWRLFPDSTLVLHAHLQPSGKPETVKFRIGLRFAAHPPELRPVLLRIGSCDIDIPAGATAHTVTDTYTLPIDVEARTIFPHAHSLCQSLSVTAEKPDGTRESLIAIDRFDENWHEMYRYRQPVRLPRGTRLVTRFTYDNSEGNVRNRHRPPRRTVYGSNADDEMADVYLQVTPVRADQRAVLMEHFQQYDLQSHITGFRKSLELAPDDPWSLEALAAGYVGRGDFASAIPILERRLAAEPAAVFPRVSLGMALTARGDSLRAEGELRRALAADKEYPLAWFGLGLSLTTQKKYEPAEEAYRRAADLAPGLVDAK